MNDALVSAVTAALELRPAQVRAVAELPSGGATIPFVARYRKEATGSLDEVAIAWVWDRFEYLTQLGERQAAVLASIDSQGKLTDELAARGKGLAPLAERLLGQGDEGGDPFALAAPFVNPEAGVATAAEALAGAGHILAEGVAHDPETRAKLRALLWAKGKLRTTSARPWPRCPPTGCWRCAGGGEDGVLRAWIEAPEPDVLGRLAARFVRNPRSEPFGGTSLPPGVPRRPPPTVGAAG